MSNKEWIVKGMFWPWYAGCIFWGGLAYLAGLDRLQTDEGRKYNDENFKRAKEGLKDI